MDIIRLENHSAMVQFSDWPHHAIKKQDLMQQYEQTKLMKFTHLESPMLTEPEAQTVASGGSVEGLGITNDDTVEDMGALLLDDDDELIADDLENDFEIVDWA
jgi:hypothetical protein